MSVKDIIKGIVICRESGEYLIDLIYDSYLNPMLLSSFVGALSLFGKDRLGTITSVSISGLDVDMIIAYKYQLILIAILSKGYATYGVRNQAEKALEMFYSTYFKEMESKNCINLEEYADFKRILFLELWKYIEDLNGLDKKKKLSTKEYKIMADDLEEHDLQEKLAQIDFAHHEIDEALISRYFKGFIICNQTGNYLVDLVFDPKINLTLLSSFVGALSLFGEETMKKIEEINILGLDVDMIMISKYDLILILIVNKNFPKRDLIQEAELTLDMFFSSYQEEIESNVEKSKYFEFKNLLYWQILDYFKKIQLLKEKKEKEALPDYGLLTDAIFKLRKENK